MKNILKGTFYAVHEESDTQTNKPRLGASSEN